MKKAHILLLSLLISLTFGKSMQVKAAESSNNTNNRANVNGESLKLLDDYSYLSTLKDWMKSNNSPGVSPGVGIPGLWNSAFSSAPTEGKLYLPQQKDSVLAKVMSVNNQISPAFTNDDDAHMLLLPVGSGDPSVVVEKADEYALYTEGGGLSNHVIAKNQDATAELELTADASGVNFKVTRLVEDTQPTETATLNTIFTFSGVKSVINATVAEYANGNTGGGKYSEFSGYYYTTANVTVDLAKYLAADRTTLKIKEEDPILSVGDTWDAANYFISATDQEGNAVSYDKITVSGTVDTATPGSYPIVYSYGGITKNVTVTVKPVLTLTVPEAINFGSYQLGSASSKLYWEKDQDVTVQDESNNGWQLAVALANPANEDFAQLLHVGETVIGTDSVAVTDGTGTTVLNQTLEKEQFLYINYASVKEVRKDKATLNWTLTPSIMGVQE